MRVVTIGRTRYELVDDHGCGMRTCPNGADAIGVYQIDKNNQRLWPGAGLLCRDASKVTDTEEVPDE